MSDSKNDTVHIDPALKARLAALASRSGRTLDELAQSVLRSHADEQERGAAEYAEDEQRWQRYLQSGQSVPFETVRSRLQKLAGEAAHMQGGA